MAVYYNGVHLFLAFLALCLVQSASHRTCGVPKGIRPHAHLDMLRSRWHHLAPALGLGPEEGVLPLLHHLLLRRLLRVQPILREHFTLHCFNQLFYPFSKLQTSRMTLPLRDWQGNCCDCLDI